MKLNFHIKNIKIDNGYDLKQKIKKTNHIKTNLSLNK